MVEASAVLIYNYKKHKIIYVLKWENISGSSIVLEKTTDPNDSYSWVNDGSLEINKKHAYIKKELPIDLTIYYYRLNGTTPYIQVDISDIINQIDNNLELNSATDTRVIVYDQSLAIKYLKQ